ncbi:MAG TPA: twin-arginine translocase subunit TatC [Anaeromyxobacteraceae bacterium]
MTEPAKKALPPPEAPAAPEEVRQSFFEHLQDLRKRLIQMLLGVAVGMALMGYWCERIFRWVMQPVLKSLPEGQQYLHYTGYIEPFMVYLKVALYGGIFVAAPWVLLQLWLFVAPGLYKRERSVVVPFLASATLLFYGGAAFCYFLVMPYAFPALAAIAGDDMKPILTMTEQLSLVLAMLLGFGIIFEVPVIIGFLSMVGLVSVEFLTKYRRHAIVANVTLAAIITPTGDPFNLALMAVPMILFYEIGIVLARILGKKKPPDAAPA